MDLDPKRARAYMRGPGNPERHERPARFHQADALLVLDEILRAQRGGMSSLLDHMGLGPIDFIWASPPCQAHSILRKLTPGKEYPDLIPATRERLIATEIPYAIENVPGAPLGGFMVQLCGTMFGLQTPDGRAELRRHRLFETSWPIALRPACQHGHEGIRESLTVTGTGMGPGNRGKDAEQARRRAISISGHASEISPSNWGKRQAAGGKAMSGGMMTSQGELKRRALSVVGNSAEMKLPGYTGRRAISVTGNTAQTNLERNVLRETFSTDDARHAMGIDWMAMKDLSQAIPPPYSCWIGKQALEFLGATP